MMNTLTGFVMAAGFPSGLGISGASAAVEFRVNAAAAKAVRVRVVRMRFCCFKNGLFGLGALNMDNSGCGFSIAQNFA